MESNAPMLHDSTRDYNRVRLWFGLVGGAVAWLVHLMGAYAIAEFGCVGTTQEYSFLGITLVSWLLIGLTLVTTAAALLAAWAAHGMEQTQPAEPSEVQRDEPREARAPRFLLSPSAS